MNWFIPREPINAWTHGVWALAAIPATLLLWRLCRRDRAKQLSLATFGVSLFLCFGGSSLYHGVRLPAADIEICRQIDHIGIYLLIAGTVTPAAVVLLTGWRRGVTLSVAWGMAALGIMLQVAWPQAPQWLYTMIYLSIGWGFCLSYFAMGRVLPPGGMQPVWIGGMFYTVGAILNLAGWPKLVPGIFSTHELWHLFCIAGSSLHIWFMLRQVVPFKRPQPRPAIPIPMPIPALGFGAAAR
jgi:hemolysin III